MKKVICISYMNIATGEINGVNVLAAKPMDAKIKVAQLKGEDYLYAYAGTPWVPKEPTCWLAWVAEEKCLVNVVIA